MKPASGARGVIEDLQGMPPQRIVNRWRRSSLLRNVGQHTSILTTCGSPFLLRVEQSRRRIFAIQILGDFAADEAAADRVARPSSTFLRTEQASGQSSAQTECRISINEE